MRISGALEECLPVETEDFAKNQNEDHANEDPGLLHVGPDTAVTDNADAVASGETSQTNGKTASKVQKAPAKRVSE
jgi:hypothetical protein